MARTGDDTWDLASSVGATATAVAAARAVATNSPDPLITDQFAEPLVKAVGVDFFTQWATGGLDPASVEGNAAADLTRMANAIAVRPRFFDEFFLDAAAAGIRQMVILASGLDTRAYRLPWPAGSTIFEIDQPQVIEFKTTTLAGLGAYPSADRRPVAIDLRQDWPTALGGAGFDANQPTAWIAEGLLGYLPPEAQDRLLDSITALSAEGSRLAVESITNLQQLDEDRIREQMRTISERWQRMGLDLDTTELVYLGDRNEAAEYLQNHGWDTVEATPSELWVHHGLDPIDQDDDKQAPLTDIVYVSATLK
jgi:methyltransferase (TIGR00027 family)